MADPTLPQTEAQRIEEIRERMLRASWSPEAASFDWLDLGPLVNDIDYLLARLDSYRGLIQALDDACKTEFGSALIGQEIHSYFCDGIAGKGECDCEAKPLYDALTALRERVNQ